MMLWVYLFNFNRDTKRKMTKIKKDRWWTNLHIKNERSITHTHTTEKHLPLRVHMHTYTYTFTHTVRAQWPLWSIELKGKKGWNTSQNQEIPPKLESQRLEFERRRITVLYSIKYSMRWFHLYECLSMLFFLRAMFLSMHSVIFILYFSLRYIGISSFKLHVYM